ncbi:MAG: T9SS C-terminal target domain-containing protein [Ignavibacteriae bacterium]|nr:MAG: T9SS C-terminal target domain-containing protein [Ignavibacteriota bacterium]
MKKIIYTLMFLAFVSMANAQWSEQTSGLTTTLYSVSAVDNDVVWICGAGGKVLRTINGGTNWNLTVSPNSSLDLYNIWGVDANIAYVTGSSSTTYVYRTANGGGSWTQIFSQVGGFINAIHGVSLNEPEQMIMYGDPVGGRWSIWINNPGGWDSTGFYLPQTGTETGYNNAMFAIRGPQSNTKIWFGTNNTRIYKWTLSTGWISQPTPGQVNSLAIVFPEEMIGFGGGSTGLLHTSNGGSIWSDLPGIPGSGSINGLAYGNSIGELFLSRGTSIYRTTSFGVNWAVETTQTGTYTHLQKARTGYNLWAIRNNGGISKYTAPIGIKSISSEVPQSFSLSQNYPNPFNPKTIINFQLPMSNFVKLIVYDMMGREVTTLVNEKLNPGTYEVDWNAINYPSGVYFYKLQTESFSETKKMVLVK